MKWMAPVEILNYFQQMKLFRLVAQISKVQWTEEDREQILTRFKTDFEIIKQTAFFEYCKQWKLAPWIWIQLNRNQLTSFLDEKVQVLFQKTYEKVKIANEKRNENAVRFLTALKEKGLDVIVLKGNLFAHTLYQDVGYKRMNDFDILIHKQDWGKIQDVYLSLGYIPLGFGWSGEKEKPAKYSHVGMSFISPDFSCIIGSQWGLKSPSTKYKVDIAKVWKTAIDFDFTGIRVKQLSPEYNLLHLILHMGVYKCGIRDCMDVYNLVDSGKVDSLLFQQIIQECNALDKSIFTLELSRICSQSNADTFTQLNSSTHSFLIRRLKKRMRVHERTGDFQNSYNDYFQEIEKEVIYFNLFPSFHKKTKYYSRILSCIFAPKLKIALQLSDAFPSTHWGTKMKARIKAPYFVFSIIAQEIGWKFTFLLFVKLFVDLLFSLKNYFLKKDSYFDYLKSKNIDPKSIEKVVKNIQ